MKKILCVCFFAVSLAFLSACGDKGSSDSGDSIPVKKGRFLQRGPVQGIHYVSGDQSGITDAEGTFTYTEGATITFRVGNIEIGQGIAFATMTLVDLVSEATDTSYPTLSNIARFLQTLDQDGDPENGIALSEEVHLAAREHFVDFDASRAEFETSPSVQNVVKALTALNATGPRFLVSAAEAQAHLEATLRALSTAKTSTQPTLAHVIRSSSSDNTLSVDAPPLFLTVAGGASKNFMINASADASYTFIVRNLSGNWICVKGAPCQRGKITLRGTGRQVFTVEPRRSTKLKVCATSTGNRCPHHTLSVDAPPLFLTVAGGASKNFMVNASADASYTFIVKSSSGHWVCVNGSSHCRRGTITLPRSGRQVFTVEPIRDTKLEVCATSTGNRCPYRTLSVDAPPLFLTVAGGASKNIVVNASADASYTFIVRSLSGNWICVKGAPCQRGKITLRGTGRQVFTVEPIRGTKLKVCATSTGNRCPHHTLSVDAPLLFLTVAGGKSKNFMVNASADASYTFIVKSSSGDWVCVNGSSHCRRGTITLHKNGRQVFTVESIRDTKLEVCATSTGNRCPYRTLTVNGQPLRLTLTGGKSKTFMVNADSYYTFVVRSLSRDWICVNGSSDCRRGTITRWESGRQVFTVESIRDTKLEVCAINQWNGRCSFTSFTTLATTPTSTAIPTPVSGLQQTLIVNGQPLRLTIAGGESKNVVVNARGDANYTFIVKRLSGDWVCVEGATHCLGSSGQTIITLSGTGRQSFNVAPYYLNTEAEVCARMLGSSSCEQQTLNVDDVAFRIAATGNQDIVVNASAGSTYNFIVADFSSSWDSGVCVNGASHCTTDRDRTITLSVTGSQVFTLVPKYSSRINANVCARSEGRSCAPKQTLNVDDVAFRIAATGNQDIVVNASVGSTYNFIVADFSSSWNSGVCVKGTSHCTTDRDRTITLSGTGSQFFKLQPRLGSSINVQVCARSEGSSCAPKQTLNVDDVAFRIAATGNQDIVVNASAGSTYNFIVADLSSSWYSGVCVKGTSHCTTNRNRRITLSGTGSQLFTLQSRLGSSINAQVCARSSGRDC